jgi:hypothetical protein
MGKPVVLLATKYFEIDAKLNAKMEGVADLSLVVLPTSAVPLAREIEELHLGELVADGVVSRLTQGMPAPGEREQTFEEELDFPGRDYPEAVENMEKFFLQHRWSDGFPLVPPTEEAIQRMLEGTDLPRDHVVGRVMPIGADATIEKIAVNATMAGCVPHYFPAVIAAVEAITDARFDLLGVQCTAGLVSPLLVMSGPQLIQQLNVNEGFSTLGPGWRANSTIGRAVRLVMINIGHAWPGNPDMKSIGTPFKYVKMLAENERAYGGAWEPIRVAEGFSVDQATVSVMPAFTWQVEYLRPEVSTTHKVVELLTKQAKVKYDKEAVTWGMDNLILLSPTACEAIHKEGYSRSNFQKLLYDAVQLPCAEFFEGKEPKVEVGAIPIPEEIVARCKDYPQAIAPLLRNPESLKIVATGGYGPAFVVYVSTWGWGPSYFVTKEIKLPKKWGDLVEKYKGWETPIIK